MGLLVLSIALATTLWTAVTRVAFSSVESFERSIGLGDERFRLRISARGGRLDARSIARGLRTLPAVSDLVFIKREPGLIAPAGDASRKGSQIPITVIGLGGVGSRDVGSVGRSGVAISPGAMRSLGVEIGDLVTLQFGSQTKTVSVERLRSSEGTEFSQAALISLEYFPNPETLDEILLAPHSEVVIESFIADLSVWLSSFAGGELLAVESVVAPVERARQVTAAYRFNIFIVAAMSLCVCALLVYQATQLSLLALSREVSILSVLGISGSELVSALVMEAALASACGAIVGLVIGYPSTLAITKSLLSTAFDLYGVEFSSLSRTEAVLRAIATIITVTLVGSVSATVATARAISGSVSHGARRERIHIRPVPRRLAIGAPALTSLLLLLALLSLQWRPTVVGTYAAIGLCLVWVAGLSIGALALSTFFWSSVSLSRLLARSLLKRSGGVYAFGIIASAVAITLMTSLTCMVGSFRGTLREWSHHRLQGDLFISSAISGDGHESLVGKAVIDGVRSNPEVARVIAYREMRDTVQGGDVVVAGTDIRAQCERRVYQFLAGGCGAIPAGGDSYVLVSESAARKTTLSLGDAVVIRGKSLQVAGIVREFGTEQPLFLTEESLFTRLYNSHGVKTLTIDLHQRADVEGVRRSIERQYREPIVVRNHQELLTLVEEIFNRTFTVTDSVRWVVFILALAGLVSGYLQHTWERRVDLRVLDVHGMSAREWSRMFCTEAFTIVLVPVVTGGIGGALLGYILTEYLNPLVFGWRLRFALGSGFLVESIGFMILSVILMLAGSMFVLRRVRRVVGLRDE